jgi:hypothetical protein
MPKPRYNLSPDALRALDLLSGRIAPPSSAPLPTLPHTPAMRYCAGSLASDECGGCLRKLRADFDRATHGEPAMLTPEIDVAGRCAQHWARHDAGYPWPHGDVPGGGFDGGLSE